MILIVIILLILFFFINKKENYTSNYLHFDDKMKLNVIIPIRNREKDLYNITNVLEKIFEKQDIDARYIIIEQEKGKKFNKGKISNAAFLISRKDNFSDNYLFNDVDLWPNKASVINYRKKTSNSFIHPYGHKHCLGGFFMTDKSCFEKINGYSNNYWGWGGEDVDLQNRANAHRVFIDRKNFMDRGHKDIRDDISSQTIKSNKNLSNQIYKKNKLELYKKNPSSVHSDGLSTCKYNIVSQQNYKNNPKMKRILISI